MKRYLKFSYIISVLTLFIACEKSAYNYKDGYQDGEKSGTESPEFDMKFIDKSMLNRARIFPGLVGENVKRIQDTTIQINLDFKWLKRTDLKVQVTPSPVFSTGLYAGAGENVRITVPDGLVGLEVIVGAHLDNLTGKEALRRDPLIYTVKALFPGENYIRNPYGGTIWINPTLSKNQIVNLKFENVVRSSDFILGVSNQANWLNDVRSNDVPWLELRGNRTIFTVPRDMVLRYESLLDVKRILETWDEIYEKDYYDWMGLTPEGNGTDIIDSYPALPERGVLDIHPSAGYAHSGFPWVAQLDRHWFLMFSSYDYFIGSVNSGEGAWGTFHEIGHNYQQVNVWSWDGLGETTNNLFVFKTAHRLGNMAIANHPALKTAIPAALNFASSSSAKNFQNIPESIIEEGQLPFFKLTPFLQIFNKSMSTDGKDGWSFMTYLYTKARRSNMAFAVNQAKIDFFYRALCEYTGQDYFRFFNAWGIPLSSGVRREMRETYIPINKSIWKYNPLTNVGGNEPLETKYDLNNSLFTYIPNVATATNEGAANVLSALNDGNLSTYWHTCYSGCTSVTALPVIITVDLKSLKAFKGLYYANRNHPMTNKRMKISYSTDGIAFYPIIDADNLPNSKGTREEIDFGKVYEARYIRVEFPESNRSGSAHVALGELGLYFDK